MKVKKIFQKWSNDWHILHLMAFYSSFSELKRSPSVVRELHGFLLSQLPIMISHFSSLTFLHINPEHTHELMITKVQIHTEEQQSNYSKGTLATMYS